MSIFRINSTTPLERADRQLIDSRVSSFEPIISPHDLKQSLPAVLDVHRCVLRSRGEIAQIISGDDPRLLCLVGPCSIHDSDTALDYAQRLAKLSKRIRDRICVVMRVYFEKPRTKLGWRGLILDPHLDGTNDVAEGLRRARSLLIKIGELGLAAGTEFLDSIVPQYIDDLISWASIGARTTESQIHREMASGLSMPVGFKNGTDGDVIKAINALAAARHPHTFIGINQIGRICAVRTTGNHNGHLVLRGGNDGPNYDEVSIDRVRQLLRKAGYNNSIMIDCNHANSGKDHTKQGQIFRSAVSHRISGIVSGAMLESNIESGYQNIDVGAKELQYGVSITDPCIGWDETNELLIEAYHRLNSA